MEGNACGLAAAGSQVERPGATWRDPQPRRAAPALPSASQASANTPCAGQADAIATLIRRTLFVTSTPIFNSVNRIAPQVTYANSVSGRAIRRSAQINI